MITNGPPEWEARSLRQLGKGVHYALRARHLGRTTAGTAPTGSDPGSKLSATQPKSEQLKKARARCNAPGTPGSLRLGAGRSQVQILSLRVEHAANLA